MNHASLSRKFSFIFSTYHQQYRIILRLTDHRKRTMFKIFPTQNQYHTCHTINQSKYLLSSTTISDTTITRRLYSSKNDGQSVDSNTNKDNNKYSTHNESIFRKIKRMVDIFWSGCKALGRDVRVAVHTRRKLGLYHAHEYDRLTRQELRHLRQVHMIVLE